METNKMDDIKITVTGAQVYKAIKNYLHNEMHVSREDIIAMIDAHLKHEVKAYIESKFGTSSFDNYIRQILGAMMQEGVRTSLYSDPMAIDKVVVKAIQDAAREEFIHKYTFSIKEKQNG
jgi:hypothetical protein